MKLDKKSLLLYAVTDRTWLGEKLLHEQVEETIRGGATFIQLREKDMSNEDFITQALIIKQVTDRYNIPFVINDNIEVALAVDADGVHVGQSDMQAKEVRRLIGNDKILGVSAQTVGQAVAAEESGADYIGVGAVFLTSTKQDADSVSRETLKAICRAVNIPVVAIGGISKDNLHLLKGTGIAGAAVISAIFAKPDIYEASKELRKLCEEIL